jgi:predicted membrane-bound spermidine synthase
MDIILFLISGAAFLAAIILIVSSETVFQEILAGISFVVWAVLLIGAGITSELRLLRKRLNQRDDNSRTRVLDRPLP